MAFLLLFIELMVEYWYLVLLGILVLCWIGKD